MLRRVENVRMLVGEPGWLGDIKPKSKGRLHVFVGSRHYWTTGLWASVDLDALKNASINYPQSVITSDDRTLWLYQNKFYWENDGLDADEIYAVITARDVRSQNSVSRAKSIAGLATAPQPENRRGHISEELRQLVWMRDGGACTRCGSRVELQFDHIIPVAMGGATNEGNLQILCGPCNRTKGNSVG